MKININGREVDAPAGSTILEAARLADLHIPTLCYLKDLNPLGACRMCVVEVKGAKNLVASCITPISPGMEIRTDTPDVMESRRRSLDLICSRHRMDCDYCVRYSDCELHALCREYNLSDKPYGYIREPDYDDSAVHLIRDKSKCVLCRRCVSVCRKSQSVGAIGVFGRGLATSVGSALPIADTTCVHCGQCISLCPTGALTERDDTRKVWMALNDPSRHVIAVVSPFVGAQLGECFLEPVGAGRKGKVVAALRRLGFNRVFDMEAVIAGTVMEEGAALLALLKEGGRRPLLTSACPGWMNFCKTHSPEWLTNVSVGKNPGQVFGALSKSDYAEKTGIAPQDIFIVSIKPCTAEKFACRSQEPTATGCSDVDVSLTTRELSAMIKRACVSNFTSLQVWRALPDESSDPFPGVAFRPGHILGANGGILEAVLDASYRAITGKPLPGLNFTAIPGNEAIREAEVDLNGTKVRIATASGLANAAKLLKLIQSGEKDYTCIEMLACPGGCINGGGQPRQPGPVHNFTDLTAGRAKALFS